MLSRQTRAVTDHIARPLLPFPFRNDANVDSRSGWNAATTVISEFLLVRSLPRHSHFMYHVCARTRSSSSATCPFARFIRGAVRTTRSLVHHSWVSLRDGSINPTIILRAEVDEEIISNSHARNRTHLPRLDCRVFIIIGYWYRKLYRGVIIEPPSLGNLLPYMANKSVSVK